MERYLELEKEIQQQQEQKMRIKEEKNPEYLYNNKYEEKLQTVFIFPAGSRKGIKFVAPTSKEHEGSIRYTTSFDSIQEATMDEFLEHPTYKIHLLTDIDMMDLYQSIIRQKNDPKVELRIPTYSYDMGLKNDYNGSILNNNYNKPINDFNNILDFPEEFNNIKK